MPGPDEIIYSVDEMTTKAGEINSLAEELRQEAIKMNNIIAGLEGRWEGKEYEGFLEEYEQFKGHQQTFAETIELFGTYLQQAAERASTQDEANRGRVETLID